MRKSIFIVHILCPDNAPCTVYFNSKTDLCTLVRFLLSRSQMGWTLEAPPSYVVLLIIASAYCQLTPVIYSPRNISANTSEMVQFCQPDIVA